VAEQDLQVVPQHVPLRGPQEAHQAGIRMLVSHHGGPDLLQGHQRVSDVGQRGPPRPAPQHSSSKSFTGRGIPASPLPVPGSDLGGSAAGGPPPGWARGGPGPLGRVTGSPQDGSEVLLVPSLCTASESVGFAVERAPPGQAGTLCRSWQKTALGRALLAGSGEKGQVNTPGMPRDSHPPSEGMGELGEGRQSRGTRSPPLRAPKPARPRPGYP